MNPQQINELRSSLAVVQSKGKLDVLCAVSGIKKDRLEEIINGDDPTFKEFISLEALR